jgi:hypothetical protein
VNIPKRLGTAAEVAVVRYLRHFWPDVERRALAGINDRGDIAGLTGLVVEVKNHRALDLAGWVGEAQRESAGCPDLGVVWHKRRGKGSPADWYVTMDGATFVALLKETGR